MNKLIPLIVLLTLTAIGSVNAQKSGGAAWRVTTQDDFASIRYPQDRSHVVLAKGAKVWSHNTTTGQLEWTIEVPDHESDGLAMVMLKDRFLLSSTKNNIVCYATADGKKLWELPLDGIDQSNYSAYTEEGGDLIILRYEEKIVQINTSTGKEQWRSTINMDLREKGEVSLYMLPKSKRTVVFTKDATADVFDDASGKRILSVPCKPNMDIAGTRSEWVNVPETQNTLVLLDEESVIILDVVQGTELARKPFKIDGDLKPLYPDSIGCMILGADALMYVNTSNGKSVQRPFSYSDMRGQSLLNVNGKWQIWMASVDKMVVLDAEAPALLWESAANDKQFAGFAHSVFAPKGGVNDNGGIVLAAYVEPRSDGDNPGTYLYAQGINAQTGKVVYKNAITVAKDVVSSKEFKDIGMWYSLFELKGTSCIAVASRESLLNPSTKTEPGEGLVAFNSKTGAVLYSQYFAVAQGMDEDFGEPPVEWISGVAYMAGNRSIVAVDLATGKKLWTIDKDLGGQAFAIDQIDGVVYAKIGKKQFTAVYTLGNDSFLANYTSTSSADKFTASDVWSSKPFGFTAIDASTGKLLWHMGVENDPEMAVGEFAVRGSNLMKSFSFRDFYDESKKQLYYSDLDNVYALKMGPQGGTLAWTLSLDDAGLGDVEYENAFGYDTKEQTLTQPVKLNWDGKSLLMFGQDAIGALNTSSGKTTWVHEWRYGRDKVKYVPRMIGTNLLYSVRGKIVYLDLATGSTLWSDEIADDASISSIKDSPFLITWDDDVLAGYKLK